MLFYPFSLLAAIHLFISSHDEIKDFCSMDKKTGRRYLRRVRIYTSIHLQTFVLSVTVGSVNPTAHFCVREICIITNNVVSINIFTKPQTKKSTTPIIVCLQNFSRPSSVLPAIHLFTRSVTKSKISTSPVKKLVAATCCVCKIIHSQTLIEKK